MKLALAFFLLFLSRTARAGEDCVPPPPGRDLALVYFTGLDSDSSVPLENAAPFEVFASAFGLRTVFVRPGEIRQELLDHAALFVLPGGEDAAHPSEAPSTAEIRRLRRFLRDGGKLFGACLGGYWAARSGSWPGRLPTLPRLGVLPARVRPHSGTPEERLEPVLWRDGSAHLAFFQDGPEFLPETMGSATVYARYRSNGAVATLSANYGGHHRNVMVSGVHWEAPASWYRGIKGGDPEPGHLGFQLQLFTELLCRPPPGTSPARQLLFPGK